VDPVTSPHLIVVDGAGEVEWKRGEEDTQHPGQGTEAASMEMELATATAASWGRERLCTSLTGQPKDFLSLNFFWYIVCVTREKYR
jgi:hypothetical protein